MSFFFYLGFFPLVLSEGGHPDEAVEEDHATQNVLSGMTHPTFSIPAIVI